MECVEYTGWMVDCTIHLKIKIKIKIYILTLYTMNLVTYYLFK